MKRVVVIGSGNVAEILAEAIADGSGYALVQIYARNRERGEYIAGKVGCGWTDYPQSLADADIYLIAVSDTAVGPIARMLDFGGAVVAHTAGIVPNIRVSSTPCSRLQRAVRSICTVCRFSLKAPPTGLWRLYAIWATH